MNSAIEFHTKSERTDNRVTMSECIDIKIEQMAAVSSNMVVCIATAVATAAATVADAMTSANNDNLTVQLSLRRRQARLILPN